MMNRLAPPVRFDRWLTPLHGALLQRLRSSTVLALLFLATPVMATAQNSADLFHSGLKLKGGHIYNRSSLDTEQREFNEAKTGWGAGIEIVGRNIGIGLTGFTAGRVSEFQSDTTRFVALAEMNYYAPIRLLRLAPYAGVHTGLGTYTKAYFAEPYLPQIHDRGLTTIGMQVGARWQPIALGSVDVQWRRLAASAAEAQDSRFERSQIILGVTLF